MKTIFTHLLVPITLLISCTIYAQIGIGTITPDPSSILDVFSDSKGLLMPRLSTTERDNITLPAKGLMVYNTTLNDGQLNIGTPVAPSWVGVKSQDESTIESVTEGDNISTTSTSDLLVPGMTVSPLSGTYLVSFNAQHNVVPSPPLFSSDQAVIDMEAIYQDLTAMSGGTPHGLVFGNGEILPTGIYDVAGAPSIAGILVMDGGGDPNAEFVIRGTGAFSTGAGTIVTLINGASANNIFWMSEVALSTGASTTLKGTMVSPAGAISLGANTDLEGRMLTKSGTVTIVADCVVTVPSGASPVDLGVLSSLAMFSSAGAVSDAATSTITGDVGTASGALTIIGTHFGEEYPSGTTATTAPNPITTYSIYQNGVKVLNSSRIIKLENSVVSLQAIITTVATGEVIEVRWKVDTGEAMLDNRIVSLTRSGY